MARMGRELENPALSGEYYRLADRLPDTDENRMAYVREKHLGWRAAAIGLNVERHSQEAEQDEMEIIWEHFIEIRPDEAMEWACGLVECSPYYDSYCEWRDRPCMEVSARRSIA